MITNNNSTVYLVTGKDVDTVEQTVKPAGIAKGKSMDTSGHSKSYETEYFINKVFNFIRRNCLQVKNPQGEPVTFEAFYIPKYKKDGTLKSFEFDRAVFI